jgi:hypothetical protein
LSPLIGACNGKNKWKNNRYTHNGKVNFQIDLIIVIEKIDDHCFY